MHQANGLMKIVSHKLTYFIFLGVKLLQVGRSSNLTVRLSLYSSYFSYKSWLVGLHNMFAVKVCPVSSKVTAFFPSFTVFVHPVINNKMTAIINTLYFFLTISPLL